MIKKIIKGNGIYFFLGAVILIALLLKIFSQSLNHQEINNNIEKFVSEGENFISSSTAKNNQAATSTNDNKDEAAIASSTTSSTGEGTGTPETIEPIMEFPKAGSTVSSPLVVKGQAPGNWFFESSLPVKLLDNQGRTIAQAEGLSSGNSLTDQLVPFSTLLEFETTATSGYLIISNDNPSGISDYSKSISFPVLFLTK